MKKIPCPCCYGGILKLTQAAEDIVLACYACTHNINGDKHLCHTAQQIIDRRMRAKGAESTP